MSIIHIIIQWLMRVSGMEHLTKMKTKRTEDFQLLKPSKKR